MTVVCCLLSVVELAFGALLNLLVGSQAYGHVHYTTESSVVYLGRVPFGLTAGFYNSCEKLFTNSYSKVTFDSQP